MNDDKSKRAIPEIHIDTLTLYERLKKVTHAEPIITYGELGNLISQDIQKEAYGKLHTARSRLMRYDGIRFGTVRGVGLKLMNDVEVGLSGESEMSGLRRSARRSVKRLSCIQDFDGLDNEIKTKCLASRALIGTIHEFLKPKQVKKLENCASAQHTQISMHQTIEALMGTK